MGIDAGFDMVPRLSKREVDKQNWHSFIEFVKDLFRNDDLVEIKPSFLEFKAGEHPKLPFEGHKFLRFSSKISGSHARGIEKYINIVTRIAQANFSTRIQCWNEAADRWGFYGWPEVNDSLNSYVQVS